jgi:hypothetical protein
VSQETSNRTFDDLARAVAQGSLSRRRALKLFAGTALAALIPSRALADEECVRVCHVPFDRETEECDFANAQTRCVSRRERRRHLENHPCDCRGRCANCLTPACPPERTLTEGDCNCAAFCNAPDLSLFVCQNNIDCLCTKTTEGTGFCANVAGGCDPPCSSSSDCPSGWKCVVDSCCATPICDPPCSSSTSAAPASSAQF